MTDQATSTKTAARTGDDAPETATERVAQKTHDVVDKVAANISKREESLRTAATDTEEQLKQLATKAEEAAAQDVARAKRYISEKPLASIGIAFGAGLLVSALLRR
jgi:ElaB/YqjD/DUF883 family membrane-anchored ribosome-binding protein